jgi:hypothetical protein
LCPSLRAEKTTDPLTSIGMDDGKGDRDFVFLPQATVQQAPSKHLSGLRKNSLSGINCNPQKKIDHLTS